MTSTGLITASSDSLLPNSSMSPTAKQLLPTPLEKLLTILTMTVLLTGMPTDWNVSPTEALTVDQQAAGRAGGDVLVVIVLSVLLGSGFLRIVGQGRYILSLIRAFPPLALFLSLAALSMFWSAIPQLTLRRAGVLILIFLYGYYMVLRYTLREAMLLLAIASAATTALCVVYVVAFPEFNLMGSGAWSGIYLNKNRLGQNALLCALLEGLWLFTAGRWRSIWIAALATNILLIVKSESKTALFSVLVGGLLIIVYQAFRARRILFGAVSAGLTSAMILAILFATASLPWITKRLDKDVTLSGRTVLWRSLRTPIREHWLLGYGWDGFWRGWFSASHQVLVENPWYPPHAHNAFIDYAIALGIVGLSLFVWTIVGLTTRATVFVREVPGAPGLLPLSVVSFALLSSITEAGVINRSLGFLLLCYSVALVAARAQLGEHRSE